MARAQGRFLVAHGQAAVAIDDPQAVGARREELDQDFRTAQAVLHPPLGLGLLDRGAAEIQGPSGKRVRSAGPAQDSRVIHALCDAGALLGIQRADGENGD